MSFLTDKEIQKVLSSTPPAISGIDPGSLGHVDCAIQPCSLDLSVGSIKIPPAPDENVKARHLTAEECELSPGSCVRVMTKERFDLRGQHASLGALLFSPARLSRNGILPLDVGHVDPGFSGPLTFTLINFGSRRWPVRIGDKFVTVLLFKTADGPARGFDEINEGRRNVEQREEDFEHLDGETMNIRRKAQLVFEEKFAEKVEEFKTGNFYKLFFNVLLGGLVGFLVAYLTLFSGYNISFQEELSAVKVGNQQRLETMRAFYEAKLETIRSQLASAERSIAVLEHRLEDMEAEQEDIASVPRSEVSTSNSAVFGTPQTHK